MGVDRTFLLLGSLFGFMGVALGAFGAHALKARLNVDLLSVFETGVRYQMYHALALFAVAWAYTRRPGPTITIAGWLFVAGIVIFSGSLYMLALTGTRSWGVFTPLGGIAFLAGWLCLAWAAWTGR
jgi:uncharacterized membrane protein YgdD (TMEM256/DUF423 family)